jgi:hypothetical protein
LDHRAGTIALEGATLAPLAVRCGHLYHAGVPKLGVADGPLIPEGELAELGEMVDAAARCWAADDRHAGTVLLRRAVSVAARAAQRIARDEAIGPADALRKADDRGRLADRDLARLRKVFEEPSDVDGPSRLDAPTFYDTARALRRALRVMRRLAPGAPRREKILLGVKIAGGVFFSVVAIFIAIETVEHPEDRVYGGAGGREFSLECPSGAVMVGAEVHVRGPFVSGVSPLCLPPDAEADAEPTPTGMAGEARTPDSIRCPPGEVVVGVTGGAGAVIDRLTLLCGPAEDPSSQAVIGPSAGGSGGRYFRARGPRGAVLGLRGRAAANLDAVGPLCEEGFW